MKKLSIFILSLSISFTCFAKQPIEITAPHGPGGPSDNVARTLESLLPKGDYMTVNRPGAGSQIGTRHAINHNTLLITSFVQVFVANSDMQEDLRKLIDSELEIIAAVGIMPSVLICNKDLDIKSLNDLKNFPRDLNFGTNGPTSSSHLTTEVLFRTIERHHRFIPYPSGQAQISNDVIGGHLDCAFGLLSGAVPAMQSSNVVTIISSHKISNSIPSWNEVLKSNFPFDNVIGLTVSRSLDTSVKDKIRLDLKNALSNKDAEERFKNAGFIFYPRTSLRELETERKNIIGIRQYFNK